MDASSKLRKCREQLSRCHSATEKSAVEVIEGTLAPLVRVDTTAGWYHLKGQVFPALMQGGDGVCPRAVRLLGVDPGFGIDHRLQPCELGPLSEDREDALCEALDLLATIRADVVVVKPAVAVTA